MRITNADGDGESERDADRDCYGDRHSYCYGDGYGYSDGNPDGNSFSLAEAYTDAETASNPAASSVACRTNWNR